MKPKYFIHLTIEFFYFGEEYVDNLHVVSLFWCRMKLSDKDMQGVVILNA